MGTGREHPEEVQGGKFKTRCLSSAQRMDEVDAECREGCAEEKERNVRCSLRLERMGYEGLERVSVAGGRE